MSQKLSTSEKLHKSLALLLVRAIELKCDTSISVSITRAHRLHKQILSEFRNIERTLFTTDMKRRPVGENIETSLIVREGKWELTLSTDRYRQTNAVVINEENKAVFRRWLKSGFKPTTMADWRAHYDGL